MPVPVPADEAQRLRLLGELRILDTPPEPTFDAIARLAVSSSGCAIGVLCVVDATRLWLKARIGLDVSEMPRDAGFCAHTILGREPIVVDDARLDARFASMPLVTRPPAIRSYAAAPVVVKGHAVATVAVFDPRPALLTSDVRDTLAHLAALAADLLHARLARQRSQLEEARVRMASQASSDWLWESDADGRITWMSDSAVQHLGAQAQRALGRHWSELGRAHPRSAEDPARYRCARERREPFSDLILELQLDGCAELVVSLGGVPWFDAAGRLRGYRGAARAVTAELALREQAERSARELALSEQRWKLALEVSSQGVWDWDLVQRRLYVSAGWRALLGMPDDWQLDAPDDWPRRIHPDDLKAARALLAAHLRGQTASYRAEYRMRHQDGRWLLVLNRGKVVERDATGRARRIVGTLSDVTERRAAEAALREKQAAELASQTKSRFLSRVSHEMRTPLNAMLGFTQLLHDAPSAGGPERVREYAGHALNAGQQLLQLVDHVLDLQRLDEGRLELRIEAVAVGPLVAQAVDAVREQAQARGIRLSNEIARDGIYVRADRERLLQVLTALSNNAVKYNRPTGTVCWRAERRDDRATLIVEDSGSGMTDAQLTRLFQPFERLGRETGTVEGSGLGLIIARSLAENMGGRLSVSSRFGLGTRAIVELPLAAVEPQAAASTAAAAPPAAAATPTPLRLLYVEDNRVNALLFGEAVRVLGNVELRVAEDGSEALETVRHWQPDVLVLDAHLPGSSGFQVLEQLRGMPGLERTPAVMCSADALPDDVERARAAGFIGYWTKPIDLGRVMAELQQFAAR